MSAARAKLFQKEGSQAVRLPKECRFPEDQTEVTVRREGRRVILEADQRLARELREMPWRLARGDRASRPGRSYGYIETIHCQSPVHARHRHRNFTLRGVGGVTQRFLEREPSEVLHQFRHSCRAPLWRRATTFTTIRVGMIAEFTSPLLEAPFNTGAADLFGQVSAALARWRSSDWASGNADCGACARLGRHPDSNNLSYFGRVPGLRTENWL